MRRVPYRLPELLAADLGSMVFIVEAKRMLSGCVCWARSDNESRRRSQMGGDNYSEFLRDRIVCILPDNDSPGRDHAAKNIEDPRVVTQPGWFKFYSHRTWDLCREIAIVR